MRLSWNPDANWALQASYGFIKSPEQLDPGINQHRITASASYNNELFVPPSPLAGDIFRVSEFSLGYIYDIPVLEHLALGVGVMGTLDVLPSLIEPAYGSDPVSYMTFLRVKVK